MENEYSIESDIIGCLDYVLRHSNHFSGVRGESLDSLFLDFSNDENLRCKLKVSVEILETDESEVKPKWVGSEAETALFLKLAEAHFNGDSSIYRADDPQNSTFGFFQEKDDKTRMASVYIRDLSQNHPDVFNRLIDV